MLNFFIMRKHKNRSYTHMHFITLLLAALFCVLTFCPQYGMAGSLARPGVCGWKKQGEDSWSFYSFGERIRGEWLEDDGYRYYFDEDGTMATGWRSIENRSYYFAGADDEGHPEGSCYADEFTPDGYLVNPDGTRIEARIEVSEEAAQRVNPNAAEDVVEVSISEQHVWCYRHGRIVWDSPCVTGCEGLGRDTPQGEFDIKLKTKNVYLTGPMTASGKPAWRNHVDFWMPFHNGCGFHDADWRGTFGGNIYKWNGSHGCVNLPKEKAKLLYQFAFTGMAVSVHP